MRKRIISIIVPVYNVEKYLKDCIESILKQSMQDFELILVDDGSTDSSGTICDRYAEKDSRIKVVHTKNGGLSAARNAGIEIARGEFVAFVDSDDYVLPEFIEQMYKKILETDADICECNFSYLKNQKIINSRRLPEVALDSLNAIRRMFAPPYAGYVNTWNKLYRRKLFDKVYFPQGKLHEDEFTTYKLLFEAKRVIYINEYNYIYRQRPESIMNMKFSSKRADVLEAVEEKEIFFKQHGVDMEKELQFNRFTTQINLLNAMIDSNNVDKELWYIIATDILSKRSLLNKNAYLKKGHKASLHFIKKNWVLYWCFRKITKNIQEIYNWGKE